MSKANELIRQGITAYQSGNRVHARRLLAQALEENPNNQSAWLWLSGVVDSPEESSYCLQRVLDIDPNSDIATHARNGLAHMQAQSAHHREQQQQPPITTRHEKKLGTGELGMGELGTGELGAGELGMGEIGTGELGTGELGTDTTTSHSSTPTEAHTLVKVATKETQPLGTTSHPASSSSSQPHLPPDDEAGYVPHTPRHNRGYAIIEPQQWTTTAHNVTVVEQAQSTQSAVEILHYNSLDGSDDVHIAQNLFYVQQVGMRLKQIKIQLYGGEVILEAGALQFMKGNITAESTIGGIGGFAKKLASNVLTRESTFRPLYRGIGEIYLEPSFGHFTIIYLDNEEMIVDKGMFYAAESSIHVGIAMQKNISSALFGGEGLFQTKLTGTGWCVLSCPVPAQEIVRYQLQNEQLLVDGDFALLRKGNIEFRVSRSTKSFIGALTSGEGLLQTFFGTGEVWLAPTQDVYKRIKRMGISTLTDTNGNRTHKPQRKDTPNPNAMG